MYNRNTKISQDSVDERVQQATYNYLIQSHLRPVHETIPPSGPMATSTSKLPPGLAQAPDLPRFVPTRLNEIDRAQTVLQGTAPLRAPGIKDTDVASELIVGDNSRVPCARKLTETDYGPFLAYELVHEPQVEAFVRGGRSTRADLRNH
jgi:hypothetical protein